MSRSRKKHPVVSDYSRNTTSHSKRLASRAVRNYKGVISDGCHFKKIFPSWDIFDYKCHWFPSDIKTYEWFDEEDIKKAYRK